ncbi:MAG: BrnT family toxin [Candidatus Rokubacteria bacterium]|nr:BrnT family toxin [Candidatus Rokubacteria bacterium]
MEFEWDPGKAATNLRKHGVDFADAGTVLHDEQAITIHDDSADDEARFVTLGMDALGRTLVVVYTWRDERPRLISARRATRSERRQYEGAR